MREFYKLLHENDIPFGEVKLEGEEGGNLVEMRLSVILQKNEEDSVHIQEYKLSLIHI